jgi:hypothetical protein
MRAGPRLSGELWGVKRLHFLHAQQGGCRVERRGKEISLCQAAAHGAKGLDLGGFFDSLGNHLAVKFSGQGQDHADNVLANPIGLHAGDQRSIDFQNVVGAATERGQREIAAEVIERTRDAEASKMG